MDKENERLRLAQRYLAEQYNKMELANHAAVNITNNLQQTSGKYSTYKDKIDEGSRRIKDI